MKRFILAGLICFLLTYNAIAQIRWVREIENNGIRGYSETEEIIDIDVRNLKETELIVSPYYKKMVEMEESYSDEYYNLFNDEQIPIIIRTVTGHYFRNAKEEKKGVIGCSERKILGGNLQYEYYTKPSSIMDKIIIIDDGFVNKGHLKIRIKPDYHTYDLYLGTGIEEDDQISDFKRMKEFDKLFYNYSYAKARKREYIIEKYDKKERTYIATKKSTGIDVDTQQEKSIKKGARFYLQDMVLTGTDDDITLMAVLAKDSTAVYVPFEKIDFIKNPDSEFISAQQFEINKAQLAAEKQAETDSIAAAAERQKLLIEKYGNNFGKKVFNKELSLDMTTEMCREAWGEPSDKHRTVTKTKITEVWEYPHDKLVFENDKLVSIEQTSLLKVNR